MKFTLTFAFLTAAALATAQTRTAEIDKQRDAKAATLTEEKPSKTEARLIWIKEGKVLERMSAGIGGLRVKIGGMPTGSGFALGPDYFRNDLADGKIVFDAGLQASTRRWLRYNLSVAVPAFAQNKMFWEAYAVHRDYNSLTYYGPGPDSEKKNRSSYRHEDTSFDTLLGVKPHKWVRFGTSVGYLKMNTGPGKDSRYPSTEKLFAGNPFVPALDAQNDSGRWGVFAQLDYRDSQLGPRAGGNYSMRWDDYRDRDLKLHDFRRLDMEAQQYIPFFNKRRVIALRARTVQTFTRAGQTVPFFQQASLGGGDDLRGFQPYRFHANNLVYANAEYRWEVFSGLDMAIFGDAGQVTNDRWKFAMNNMETAVGFGFRFNVRNAPFLRLDFGFSHEGFQMYLKFNGVFVQRPWGSSNAPHVF